MKEYFQYSRVQIGFPIASQGKHQKAKTSHNNFIFKYFSVFHKRKGLISRKHVHSGHWRFLKQVNINHT